MDINSVRQSGNLNDWIALICKNVFFPLQECVEINLVMSAWKATEYLIVKDIYQKLKFWIAL